MKATELLYWKYGITVSGPGEITVSGHVDLSFSKGGTIRLGAGSELYLMDELVMAGETLNLVLEPKSKLVLGNQRIASRNISITIFESATISFEDYSDLFPQSGRDLDLEYPVQELNYITNGMNHWGTIIEIVAEKDIPGLGVRAGDKGGTVVVGHSSSLAPDQIREKLLSGTWIDPGIRIDLRAPYLFNLSGSYFLKDPRTPEDIRISTVNELRILESKIIMSTSLFLVRDLKMFGCVAHHKDGELPGCLILNKLSKETGDVLYINKNFI